MLIKYFQQLATILIIGLALASGGCFNRLYQKGYDEGVTRWKTEHFDDFYRRETRIYYRPEIALTEKQETALKQIKRDEWNKLQATIIDQENGRINGAQAMKQILEETEASQQRFKPYLNAEQLAILKSLGWGIK